MKFVITFVQIMILFLVYFIGVSIQQFFNLIIPGSVIGLLIMFGLLMTNGIRKRWIKGGASFLIRYLALFFIPATVGLMNHYEVFIGKGSLLVFTTIASTVFVMVVSGVTSDIVAKRERIRHDQ